MFVRNATVLTTKANENPRFALGSHASTYMIRRISQAKTDEAISTSRRREDNKKKHEYIVNGITHQLITMDLSLTLKNPDTKCILEREGETDSVG